MSTTAPCVSGHRMTERQFQSQVRDYARLTGWLGYHTHRSDRSDKGFPDLVLVRDRRVLWLELKSEKGRTTPEQETWLAALRQAGQDAYVVRPVRLGIGGAAAEMSSEAMWRAFEDAERRSQENLPERRVENARAALKLAEERLASAGRWYDVCRAALEGAEAKLAESKGGLTYGTIGKYFWRTQGD